MSSPTSAAPVEPGDVVSLADVEAALLRQMKLLQTPGVAPVTLARMSNLVIYCDRPELADAVNAQLPDIVALHPARVLLLLGDSEANAYDLTARIRVLSQLKSGGRTAHCELVTLHATGARVQRLPFAVRRLLVSDLPVNFWWAPPVPPPFGGVLFHELSEYAEQIIYDSIGWLEPACGVAAVAVWLAQLQRRPRSSRWCVASDLNWRRLKSWRRILSQALAQPAAPGLLEGITEVTLEHGPHAVIQAWELSSWLADRLGWRVQAGRVQPGVEIAWQLDGEHGRVTLRVRRLEQGPPTICEMRVTATVGGKRQVLRMLPEDGERLVVVPEGENVAPRTMTVPPRSLAELVGRQLSDRERDHVFTESMAVAKVLAESVLE
jgi:glucose-6-phosphate dehydrogenase assembly protein OpcA